jgi:hypothetical protein
VPVFYGMILVRKEKRTIRVAAHAQAGDYV